MSTLSTQDFNTLVQTMTAAVQADADTDLDLSQGSVLRALLEAVAAQGVWLQGLILYVLTLTRAASSTGDDLDTWVADFGLTRETATTATGQVTFSRFTTTNAATIAVGATVETTDGSQDFTVTADTANSAYSASAAAYTLAAGVGSLTVPVAAVTAGTAGNVAAGTIAVIKGAISGIDTVTNATALTNGTDAETDAALRARFVLYLAALSKATPTAIGSAIANIQQGLSYQIVENQQYDGTTDHGFFHVVVDDGSGTPSATLLATVANAIDSVRGLGIRYAVFAPVVITATVSMSLAIASGYTHATVAAAVTTALEDYIDTLSLGQTLAYTRLAAIAYGVAGVANVSSVLLNGATADLSATLHQVIKAGAVSVA